MCSSAVNSRNKSWKWIWKCSIALIVLSIIVGHIECRSPDTRRHSLQDLAASTALDEAGIIAGLYTGPYFDPYSQTNLSVQAGLTAVLPCRVRQAGSRAISWVRKVDGHLLAVGDDTFISDTRFQAQRVPRSDTWTLIINNVRTDDGGQYECQVPIEPKISRIITLNVIEPVVNIKGAPDLYVKFGSPVTLHCNMSNYLQEPSYVSWHLNGSLISQLKNQPPHPLRGNHVKQQQTKGRQQHQATGSSNGNVAETLIIAAYSDDEGRTALLQRMGNDTLFSTLTLSSVAIEDSGQYRCSPANMASAVVSFHVVIGEHPAAMQHGENRSPFNCPSSPLHLLFVTLLPFLTR